MTAGRNNEWGDDMSDLHVATRQQLKSFVERIERLEEIGAFKHLKTPEIYVRATVALARLLRQCQPRAQRRRRTTGAPRAQEPPDHEQSQHETEVSTTTRWRATTATDPARAASARRREASSV